jgi:hypothetical protein
MPKVDDKRLQEIPIKARGLMDMDDDVSYVICVVYGKVLL